MKTIWKFVLSKVTADAVWVLPVGALPVHTGIDPNGNPSVWFEIETEAPRKKTRAVIIGTGMQVPPDSNHCGTFIDGPFVWHVYLSRLPVE